MSTYFTLERVSSAQIHFFTAISALETAIATRMLYAWDAHSPCDLIFSGLGLLLCRRLYPRLSFILLVAHFFLIGVRMLFPVLKPLFVNLVASPVLFIGVGLTALGAVVTVWSMQPVL